MEFGDGVIVQSFTNLYGCRIGELTRIGPLWRCKPASRSGASCKIQSHSFICAGVTIEDQVFVGHGVIFINDRRPRATTGNGVLQTDGDWKLLPTIVEHHATLGSGAIIMGAVSASAQERSWAPARSSRPMSHPERSSSGIRREFSPAGTATGSGLALRPIPNNYACV